MNKRIQIGTVVVIRNNCEFTVPIYAPKQKQELQHEQKQHARTERTMELNTRL